jgi:Uma2 family endonuclease
MTKATSVPAKPKQTMSRDVYNRTFRWHPDAEFVDGVIEKRPGAEWDHSRWHAGLAYWFHEYEETSNVRVLLSLRVQVAPTRVRVPDVVLLDDRQPVEQVVKNHPPVAVFEILSPQDRVLRLLRKLEEYRQMGIAHIWVIDPDVNSSYLRYREGSLIREQVFSAPEYGIVFDWDAVRDQMH